MKVLKENLQRDAAALIEKRRMRLKNRKFVLFPWLRLKWLMRKYAKVVRFLGE